MKKAKVLLETFVATTGLVGLMNSPVAASKVYYHVPSVLHHNWVSPLYRTPKSQRNFHNWYWYRNLYATNSRFQLEGFVLNKNKGNNNNSGPFGVFKDYWALGYEKVSPRKYLVSGSAYSFGNSKTPAQFGIVLSRNHRALNLYSFKAKVKNGYLKTGRAHYFGHFYKGFSHYEKSNS